MKYFIILIILSINLFTQEYEVYVSDVGNFEKPPWQILKFDQNGENPTVFIDDNLHWPQDILFLEESNVVLISNFGNGKINRHNATTGEYINEFATFISGPTRMKIGPDNYLYVLQWDDEGNVRRYNLDGTYMGEFTSVGVPQSIGIDWDKDDNLYVSSYYGRYVRKYDKNGNDKGFFISSNLAGPTNIWFDTKGDLLVSDYDGVAVKRFDSEGNYIGDFLNGLNKSEGIDFLPNGNILIGNGSTQSIKMFDSNGIFIKDFVPSGSGNLLNPNAVRVRKLSGNSVELEAELVDDLIYPTTGSIFTFNDVYSLRITNYKIYDLLGNYISTIENKFESIWDANSFQNGVYLIIGNDKDGNTISQKFIIKK